MLRDSSAFGSYSVDDVEAARGFYGNKLGLDVSMSEMGFLEVTLGGGGRLMIYPKDDHRPASFTVLNFMVDDVEATVDKLNAAGIQMERYDGFGQDDKGISHDMGTIAWFKDPAGNVLAVLSQG